MENKKSYDFLENPSMVEAMTCSLLPPSTQPNITLESLIFAYACSSSNKERSKDRRMHLIDYLTKTNHTHFTVSLTKKNELNVQLERKDLSYSKFSNLFFCNANFKKAILEEVDFQGANLSEADFEEAILKGVDFQGADLSQAKISYVKGLTLESLLGAKYDDILVKPEDRENCQLRDRVADKRKIIELEKKFDALEKENIQLKNKEKELNIIKEEYERLKSYNQYNQK